jgi:Tol biopolymer transport system component
MRLSIVLVSAFLVPACGDDSSNPSRPDTPAPVVQDAAPDPDTGGIDAGTGVASRTAIVFSAALDGQAAPDLYAIEPDGSSLVRLTNTEAAELYPSWSPDHTQIAFVREFQLFTIDAGGRNELRLAQTGKERTINGNVYSTTLGPAAWSPDGTQLAYPFPRPANFIPVGENELADESAGTLIHFINADGTNDRELEPDPGNTINSIAWAPNDTLSFSQADDCADCAGGQWYGFVNVDGTGYTVLYPDGFNPNGPNKHLDWSPDGATWAYVGGLDYFSYEAPDAIYTSASFGVERTKLVASGANPRWSADGTLIAYISTDGIHIVDVRGTNDRLVLAATGVRGLDW